VSFVVMVTGCSLSDDTTMRCSGEEGVGQTVFWLGLSDGAAVAASYTWSVRPGAVPALVRAVYLDDGRAEPLPTDLAYTWPRLHGTLRLPGAAAAVDADLRAGRTVRGLTAAGVNETELTPLLRGTAIRLGGSDAR
jgi:hypothetical protein